MKRYVIFAVLGPFLGGFLLLIATTVMSGYWTETNFGEVKKLFVVLFSTLQYTYLFGILPAWRSPRSMTSSTMSNASARRSGC